MTVHTVCISEKSKITDSLDCPGAVCLFEETNSIIAIERSGDPVCKVININTKDCIYSFGRYGTGSGRFCYPTSISLIGSVVCVADYRRNAIILFTIDGEYITEMDLLENPWSLCYSITTSNLYITCIFSNKVIILSSQLPYTLTLGKGKLVQPLCVRVNQQEIVFVLDKTTNITYFQEDGNILGNITLEKIDSWSSESLNRFVIDAKGNFILCPTSLNSIIVFSRSGKQIFPISHKQRHMFQFDNPLDIQLDSKGSMNILRMKAIVLLLSYAIITVYATHSAQNERCQKLQSIANTDNAGNFVQCSVDQSCFSLNCKPTVPVLPENSEFHIIVEPCKHPAAILVNGSISGNEYSHEFTHNESVDIPYTTAIGNPQLAVVLDNSDNTTLTFSVQLVVPGLDPYTLVPETSFPLDNITCMNGHVVTSPPTPHYTTHGHVTYSCMETCVAIHNMVAKTNNLCQSTLNCLTINCNSPSAIPLIANITSSYIIEPCQSPPTILAKFDDHNNDQHYSKNITKNTTFLPPFSIPGNPQVHVTLEDPDDYSILFGVNLIFLSQSIPILPQQRIPIDKSGCPGYTGPPVNPYCTTQQTEPSKTVTTYSTTPVHSHTNSYTHVITNVSPSLNQTATGNSNAGKLAGIIIGVLLVLILTVIVTVLVTVGIVYMLMKRKSKVVYTYSHFQALEEDD
ncbi:hypothetical protein LOD99_5807 [Oopsacas minuta]|uniref:Uncharacterized protein n=1 Tax=Oopsacas minuta TaxID=111878 RepID=A0AAV7JPQ3_9METZ|nr:hypothetical protein LOD99_5807 [Oopsacas minuta]